RVDLPAPFSPRSAWISPEARSKSTAALATRLANRFVISRISTTAAWGIWTRRLLRVREEGLQAPWNAPRHRISTRSSGRVSDGRDARLGFPPPHQPARPALRRTGPGRRTGRGSPAWRGRPDPHRGGRDRRPAEAGGAARGRP